MPTARRSEAATATAGGEPARDVRPTPTIEDETITLPRAGARGPDTERDAAHTPTHIVVPADAIQETGPEAVIVDLEENEIDELPEYRPPGEATVLSEREGRLKDAAPDFSGVEAVFEGGILQLSGVVPDIASKRRAEATARSVEGVVDVENALDTDTAITARIRAALADDPRTELANVNVGSDRGIVTLTGQVDDEKVREAAEEIAEAQTGVVEVVNDLEIEEDRFTALLKGRRLEGSAFKTRP